jgi:hypothetical protein
MQIANLYFLTIYEMLPTVPKLLLLTVFAMPVAVAIIAVIGRARSGAPSIRRPKAG